MAEFISKWSGFMSDLWPFAACLLSCLSSPLFLSIQKLNWLIWLAGLCCSRHTVQIFCLGFRKTPRGASNTFLIPVDMVVSDDYMKLKDDSLELKKTKYRSIKPLDTYSSDAIWPKFPFVHKKGQIVTKVTEHIHTAGYFWSCSNYLASFAPPNFNEHTK